MVGPSSCFRSCSPIADERKAGPVVRRTLAWAVAVAVAVLGHVPTATSPQTSSLARIGSTGPAGRGLPGLTSTRMWFRIAHDTLNLPKAGDEKAGMTDGRLRVRVAVHERTWTPRWLEHDLAALHERRARCEADATLWDDRPASPIGVLSSSTSRRRRIPHSPSLFSNWTGPNDDICLRFAVVRTRIWGQSDDLRNEVCRRVGLHYNLTSGLVQKSSETVWIASTFSLALNTGADPGVCCPSRLWDDG